MSAIRDIGRDIARVVAGPSVRRLRRELQWRSCGADLKLASAPPDGYEYPVMMHSSPLYRQLAGVDEELQRNKVVNLALAVARLDALVVRPGQRLSFWRQVRKPSRRRGFLDGLVLNQGRLTSGTGGGLCQLTNLIYWMTLHTPMTVAERWRHSYDVFADAGRTQPFGSGATCAWPVLDLQIQNDTGIAFRLGLRLSDTELCGSWTANLPVKTGYEIYESDHLMTNEAPGVFMRHNVIRRRVFDASKTQVGDELIAVNQALMMYQPFLGPGR